MKQIQIICVFLCGILLCGCTPKTENLEIEAESLVEREDCYLCSESAHSLVPYSEKIESVAVVHLNSMTVTDTRVREFDDEGNEVFGQMNSGSWIRSHGDGYGSVHVSANPSRGYSSIHISVTKKDELNLELVKEMLCQTCLDQAIEFYEDQKNLGEDSRDGTSGYCLIDLATRELRCLSDPYRGGLFGDYYTKYDITSEDEKSEYIDIELLVAYLPEREEK